MFRALRDIKIGLASVLWDIRIGLASGIEGWVSG